MQDAIASTTLPNDVGVCHQLIRELVVSVQKLRSDNQQLRDRIDWLVRAHFGRRSERLEGPTLFDGFAPPEPEPAPEPVKEEVVVKRAGHGRRPKPKDLPRERVVIDVPEADKACPCCGETRIRIGEDVTEKLDYVPANLRLLEIARPTYICRSCEHKGENIQAAQAALPPEPIPGGQCAAGLLAHVIVSKYCDHLPLYRLESILARLGWNVSRSTLCDQMMKCAGVLKSLYDLMGLRVKQSFSLHTDDTPVALLNPRRTAHAWVYVGDDANPYTVFDLTDGRLSEHPAKFLNNYHGYIHADGYAGYNPLYADGAKHVGCWAHCRRYFFEAKDNDSVKAHEALGRIRELYAIEADAKAHKPEPIIGEALKVRRQQRAEPLLKSFADWLAEEVPRALPKSKIGEAFIYASNQWPTLTRYLEDGRLTIDNNPAEQAIRSVAIGRKNWLHIAGNGGLAPAAVLLSIAASAKRHRVNPWTYVKHLLTELPARSAVADLSDLLPDVWVKTATA